MTIRRPGIVNRCHTARDRASLRWDSPMFATMVPAQRDIILARFPGEGWDTERGFNLTLYMIAPHFFGAQAYRHFMRKAGFCRTFFGCLCSH
jgi:hypothetical protein